MPEQDLNPAAAKFIASLVKSLQILCNGQVDFSESIELIGHINVRIDHKFKFDYIVDEQVSKEGEDSATTFHSNSYHSCPPLRQPRKKSSPSKLDQDVMFSEISQNIHGKLRHSKVNQATLAEPHDFCSEGTLVNESSPNFSVNVESLIRQGSEQNQVVVKLEGDDDSNDCMVLPASPGDYEPVGEVSAEGFPSVGTSVSFEETQPDPVGRLRKRRQPNEQCADNISDNKEKLERRGESGVGKRGPSELIGNFAAYECSYCSVILTDCGDLNLHTKNCPSPSCNLICLTCGEKFPSKPEMRRHVKFVHGHKTFGCKFCGKMFLSSSGLLSHTKAKHKPDSKTLCQICGQAFHNKANLAGHMNMHLGLKPFKCKKCGKGYGHAKSLMTHEKSCSKSLSVRGSKSAFSSKHIKQPGSLTSNRSTVVDTPYLNEIKASTEKAKNLRYTEITDLDQSHYLFNETYKPFCDSKNIANEGQSLQAVQNASQTFSYSSSYQTLQSIDIERIANSNSLNEGLGDNVYCHTNDNFVMSHVDYDLFQSGTLPAHR